MKSVLNEAYMTPDTPFHEILAHPIIRAIKNKQETQHNLYRTNDDRFVLIKKDKSKIFFNTEREAKDYIKNNNNSTLYQNLLKELETGRGKEVFEQVKRDYRYKESLDFKYSDKIQKLKQMQEKYNSLEKGTEKSLLSVWISKLEKELEDNKYTLEEQQEEALVTLLGELAAGKLEEKENATLKKKLLEFWKQISDFVKSLLRQDGIKIDELPITTTLNDLAEIMGYGNNKIILPGYKIEYSTPLGNKYDTLEEVNNEIRGLADANVEADLSNVKVDTSMPDSFEIEVLMEEDEPSNILKFIKENEQWYVSDNRTGKIKIDEEDVILYYKDSAASHFGAKQNNISAFIEKNKEYEQSKEIIEQWKKENNIQYDPEEVYSRGQEFYHIHNAYSRNHVDTNLWIQNLLETIQDKAKIGAKMEMSFATAPKGEVGKGLQHLNKKTKQTVYITAYPKSEDIEFVSQIDNHTSSFTDLTEDMIRVFTDQKNERVGISFTKSVPLYNLHTIQPNLATTVDDVAHHNEIVIGLTPYNFRISYEENVPYEIKKLIDNFNKILDDKYGKLVKPEINKIQVGEQYSVFDTYEQKNIKSFATEKEAVYYLNNELPYDEYRYVVSSKQKIYGKQPTKTKENTTSIESVKSKLGIDTPNNFRHEDFSIGDVVTIEGIEGEYKIYEYEDSEEEIGVGTTEVFYNLEPVDESTLFDPETNPEGTGRPYFRVPTSKMKKVSNVKEKEYTSQAEINLKVAALKEVARKYSRSLITSKVVPINPNMVDNSEIQYSKVGSKQDIKGFTEFVQGKHNSVKPGVEELFESNPELANAVYEALGLNNINESEITYTDEEGNLCAKMGGRSSKFTKGSKWEIVKDLKGYPSHSQGGVDVKIGKNGFSFTRDNGIIEAKYGLVLPKIK